MGGRDDRVNPEMMSSLRFKKVSTLVSGTVLAGLLARALYTVFRLSHNDNAAPTIRGDAYVNAADDNLNTITSGDASQDAAEVHKKCMDLCNDLRHSWNEKCGSGDSSTGWKQNACTGCPECDKEGIKGSQPCTPPGESCT